MWGKPEGAKPSSPGSKSPEPSATTPNLNPSANSIVPPSASAATSPVPTVPPAPAAALTPPVPIASAFTPAPASEPAPAISSTSTIGAGLKIRGDITGNSHLVVEGEAQGKIHLANGRVTVGANGRVDADIEAAEISIEGRVQGNLKARDSVRLGPASHVQGSVLTPRIQIEDGARLRGRVEMILSADATPAAPANDAISASSAPPTASPANAAAPKAVAAKAPGA